MAGSMGIAVGAAFVAGVRKAIADKCPYIIFTASGGARMQEAVLSLMQLPKTTVALQELKEAGLPYIVVLTDPTTGGVTASYAMARPANPRIITIWHSRIQLLRRPMRSSPGSCIRSTTGDHRNLKL